MTHQVRCGYLRLVPKLERPADVVVKAGLRLRAIRDALGLQQEDMAEACGAAQNRWSNWERGDHPPDALVMARARVIYGVSLDWIYVGVADGLPMRLAQHLARTVPELVASASEAAAAPAPSDTAGSKRRRAAVG